MNTGRVEKGKGVPPPEPKKPFFVRWLGHIFSIFFPEKKKPEQVQKIDRIFKENVAPQWEIELATKAKEKIFELYYANLKLLLKLKSKDLNYLKVKEGKLAKSEMATTSEEQKVALDLIHQTYRQAWGRLIDAQHGYVIKEVELYKLNKLQDHLNRHFPEAKHHISPEQPLRILTASYKARIAVPEDIQKVRDEKRKETEEKVIKQSQRLIAEELKEEEKGINVTEFLKISKNLSPIAVSKYLGDEKFALDLFKEKKIEKPPEGLFKNYAKLASLNELIASYLNTLFDKRFGFSYTFRIPEKTVQAFVENIGSYDAVFKKEEPKLFTKMPQFESQRFALGQIALGNRDCHRNNILMRDDFAPIGIDFGHILGVDPLSDMHHMSVCFLNWPSLDQPLSNEDYAFLSQLKIEEVIAEIHRNLEIENPDLYNNEFLKPLIQTELNILAARLCLLQEAAKEELTLRQILALFFPPISTKEEKDITKEYKKLTTGKTKYFEEKAACLVLNEHMLKYGFKKAWKKSKGNLNKFRKAIKTEIKKVKKIDPKILRGRNEIKWYRQANADLS